MTIRDHSDSVAPDSHGSAGNLSSLRVAITHVSPSTARKRDRSNNSNIESATVRLPRQPSPAEVNQEDSGFEVSVPNQLGDYELLGEIARGGMGVVFRARQKRLNRIVALKVILAGQFAGDADVLRFQSEAEAAANLQHPSIVPIYEVAEFGGYHFFSMALIQGSTLSDAIRKGPLSGQQAARILAQVADAIDYAHRCGIIHRDLKPSNVLVTENGHAMVTDFGLAKRTDSDSELTGTGQVIGTPNYMSPEQASALGEEIGPTSDVYSLGAILYCLLTGRPPFHAANMMLTLRQVISKDPVSPRQLNPDIDLDLETVCLKCLEKDPAARYPTAAAFGAELRRFLAGERIVARPVGSISKCMRWCRRNPTIASLGLALSMALILLSIAGPLIANQQRELRGQSDKIAAKTQGLVKSLQRSIEETQRAQEARERLAAATDRNLIAMYNDRGDSELLDADALAALPWYAAALALDAGDPAREWGHRLRLSSILTQAPRPIRIWELSAETYASALSPDGKLIAAGGRDGRLMIWNTETGRNTKTCEAIRGRSTVITVLRFTPDNTRLMIAVGRELRMLDVRSNQVVFRYDGFEDSIRDAVFDPAGGELFVGLRDGSVHILTPNREASLRSLESHDHAITHLEISDVAERLVTASEDCSARLFAKESGETIATLVHDGPVRWAGFNRQGTLVATASDDGLVKIWDAVTGQPKGEPLHHGARIRIAKFDPSGRRIATGGWDSMAKIWDAETGKQLVTPLVHANSVPQLNFSPDGKFLITASLDHTARVWNTETGREACPAMHHGFFVQNAAFLPDGKHLMTASADKMVRLWSFRSMVPKSSPVKHTDVVLSCAIDPSGSTLLTTCSNGSAKLWDARTGQPRGIEIRHSAVVYGGSFNHDGSQFVTCGEDNRARVWSAIDGSAVTGWLEHDGPVQSVHFSPDDRFVLTASRDHLARIWSVDSGQLELSVRHKNDVNQAIYSPDGNQFMTCSDDRTACVWDVKTGDAVSPILNHQDRIEGCCFHPDRPIVATAGNDHLAQMWDVATGRPIGTPLSHHGGVHSISFSLDGTRVLTGSRDGTARLWDAKDGHPVTPPMTIGRGLVRARFSPSGSYVATACGMGAALWDARDGRLLTTAMAHNNWVTDVVFSPDSTCMISTGEDGAARIWPIAQPLAYSVSQLTKISHLVAGHRADPAEGLRPLTPSESIELLEQLSSLQLSQ